MYFAVSVYHADCRLPAVCLSSRALNKVQIYHYTLYSLTALVHKITITSGWQLINSSGISEEDTLTFGVSFSEGIGAWDVVMVPGDTSEDCFLSSDTRHKEN